MGDKKLVNGLLSAASAEKFLDMVIANAPILQLCTCPKVDMPKGTYPVVTMAQYKTQGFNTTHSGTGNRNTAATIQNLSAQDVDYTLSELVLALNIPDSYAEDMSTSPEAMADMFAKVFAKDLNDLIVNGDTANAGTGDRNTMLKILSGLVKQMASNTITYAAGDTTVTKKIIKLMTDCPADYLTNSDSRIYIAPADMNLLWDEATTTKPIVTVRDSKLYFRGKYEIVEIATLPQNSIMFGDMKGLLVPLGREIYLETQRFPEGRGTKAVLSCRIDVKVHPYINLRMGKAA